METELRDMVTAFRVTELQTLLSFAGKNKSGRKNELQARALDLVKAKPQPHIAAQVRELYRSIQLSTLAQLPPASANVQNPGHHAYITNITTATPTLSSMASGLYNQQGNFSATDKLFQSRSNPFLFTSAKMPGLQAVAQMSTVPICPDVRMVRLPFYDIVAEIHKPTTLISQSRRSLEATFPFVLTPKQAGDVASSKEYSVTPCGEQKIQYGIQVQLRFSALETTSDQTDLFPPSLIVKLNGKLVPLPHPIPSNRPGVEPKRPSRPLNVTNYVKLCPQVTNTLHVTWAADITGRGYTMSVYLVKKLCSRTLLGRLKGRGVRQADFTVGMIKDICQNSDSDCCVATTSLKVSLACPLGKCRMSLPCRASSCAHLQCFDANLFLQMNEKKPTWTCPVCDKGVLFENLQIDGYFDEIIKAMPDPTVNDVEILPDGTWTAISIKKESDAPAPKRMKIETSSNKMDGTIDLDDDLIIEDDDDEPMPAAPAVVSTKPKGSPVMIDLTLESSSGEEDDPIEAEPAPPIAQSDDEEGDEIVLRKRTKRPNYVVDETSSESSTSTKAPDSPPRQPSPSRSPTCITLDSPSSSPEQRAGQDRGNSTYGANYSTTTTATRSLVAPYPTRYNDSPFGSLPENPFSAPMTRSQSNAHERGNSLLGSGGYGSTAPTYLPFNSRQKDWEGCAYQMATDFTALDFPSMDYFNQTTYPSSNHRNSNYPGSNGGFGGSQH